MENILAVGAKVVKIELPCNVHDYDKATKAWTRYTIELDTKGVITAVKKKREGSYKYVDYVIKWETGHTTTMDRSSFAVV